jgi:hypothetical protein
MSDCGGAGDSGARASRWGCCWISGCRPHLAHSHLPGATSVTHGWSTEVLQEAPPPEQDAAVPVPSASWLDAATCCNAA